MFFSWQYAIASTSYLAYIFASFSDKFAYIIKNFIQLAYYNNEPPDKYSITIIISF